MIGQDLQSRIAQTATAEREPGVFRNALDSLQNMPQAIAVESFTYRPRGCS